MTTLDDSSACEAQRYTQTLLRLMVAATTAVVLFNFAVDPLRVVHSAWRTLPYPDKPRYLAAGLARHHDYDAITLGTSQSDNFLPSSIHRTLGWNALRLTIPGSVVTEQHELLEIALETGQVRHVLWGLDFFTLLTDPKRLSQSQRDCPWELVRRTPRGVLNYLVNADTAKLSLRTLAGKGDADLDTRGTWHQKSTFSEDAALRGAVKQLPWYVKRFRESQAQPYDEIRGALERYVVEPIRRHPEVEFVVVLPPISGVGYLPDFDATGGRFADRLRFRADLCAALADLPNARLFDFEACTDVTHDLSHYMDATHYGLPINDWMLTCIARDEQRLTPQTLAPRQTRFAVETTRFVRRLTAPHHAWSGRLEMAQRTLAVPDDIGPLLATGDGRTYR